MDELVAWLRQQLGDDEEMASKAVEHRRFPTYGELDRSLTPRVRGHIARWDPSRVLAEVEAKRRVITVWESQMESYGADAAEEAVRAHMRDVHGMGAR